MVYRVVGQDMKDSICTRIDREDKDGLKKISEIMTKIHTDRIANFDDESSFETNSPFIKDWNSFWYEQNHKNIPVDEVYKHVKFLK